MAADIVEAKGKNVESETNNQIPVFTTNLCFQVIGMSWLSHLWSCPAQLALALSTSHLAAALFQ